MSDKDKEFRTGFLCLKSVGTGGGYSNLVGLMAMLPYCGTEFLCMYMLCILPLFCKYSFCTYLLLNKTK